MALTINDLHAFAESVANGTRGLVARYPARRPERPLELYEFESCPYCRKVREAFSELDLDHISRPTPRGSERNRAKVEALGGQRLFPYQVRNVAKRGRARPALVALGGKMQVPYLIDPNTEEAMYESDAIVAYLKRTYGTGGGRE